MKISKILFQEKEIKSLDGLRAMACLMVILSHLVDVNYTSLNEFARNALDLGKEGVGFFFTISGFIITLLLFREKARTGKIRLKFFYLKRSIKIIPVLYIFLIFLTILKLKHLILIDSTNLRASFLFYLNYSLAEYSKFTGHVWSLAVEEHFYIFWPLLILFLDRKKLRYLMLSLILLSPLIRVLTYSFFPLWRLKQDIMTHCRIDGFMYGAMLADLYISGTLERFYKKIKSPSLVLVLSLIFYILIHPTLKMHSFKGYWLIAGLSVNSLVSSLIIFLLIFEKNSFLYKIFNSKMMIHLGIISYSLYVWQEFCIYYFKNPMIAVLLSYSIGLLSFIIVEQTAERIKRRVVN